MSLFDSRTARALVTICIFMGIVLFLYKVRSTLIVILFSVFFAYLVEPLVLRIQNSRFGRSSRPLAILETYLICGGALAALLVIFGPRLVEDSRLLMQSIPSLLEKVTSGKIVWQLGSRHGWSYDTQARIEQFISGHRDVLVSISNQIGSSVAASLKNIFWIVLVPILAIFFLKDGRQIAESAIQAFGSGRQRRFLHDVARDLDEMLASFIGAQLILAGVATVVYTSFLTAVHFPYGLSLGVAAGFLEFIPVVGPLVSAGVILGVGFLVAYSHLLIVALFLAAWRIVQDYLISPRVMGGKVELHPLAVIIAVLMGSEIAGVIGVYLSIPVAATLRILWVRWQRYSSGLQPAQEDAVLSAGRSHVA